MEVDDIMHSIQHGEARIVSALRLAMATSSAAENMTLNEARSFMTAYHVAMEASGTISDAERRDYISMCLGKED